MTIWAAICIAIAIFTLGTVLGSYVQDRMNKKAYFDAMSKAFADKIARLRDEFEKEKEKMSSEFIGELTKSMKDSEARYAAELNKVNDRHIKETKELTTRLQNAYANDLSTAHIEYKAEIDKLKEEHAKELIDCNEYWENREKAMKLITSPDGGVADVELIQMLLTRARIREGLIVPGHPEFVMTPEAPIWPRDNPYMNGPEE